MKIYSPSQTMKFMENPVARELSQQGWRSKYLNRGSLSAILGTGVHAAVAQYYGSNGSELGPAQLEHIYDIAKSTVTLELDGLLRLGALVGTRDAELAATLPRKARTTAKLFVEQNPLQGWVIKDVELSLPDYGRCRLDLVVEPYPGVIAGLDWKVKLKLDPRYEQQEIEGFAYSWQFMHYAWALGKHYNTTIKEFYVGWICLEPKFKVQILEYFIDPELMALWEQSAKTVWAIMAAVDGDFIPLEELCVHKTYLDGIKWRPDGLPLYHTFNWFTRYGREEYANAVLDSKMHTDLMRQDYINTKEG